MKLFRTLCCIVLLMMITFCGNAILISAVADEGIKIEEVTQGKQESIKSNTQLVFLNQEPLKGKISYEELPQEKQEPIKSNTQLVLLDQEPIKGEIQCFDVNESGLVAILTTFLEKNNIAIYDSKGEFQYGYQFIDFGTCYIEWENDNLIIYSVRGQVAMTVNPVGDILNIQKVVSYNYYDTEELQKTVRTVNGCTYTLRNNEGFFFDAFQPYAQLVITDEAGNLDVIYDALPIFTLFPFLVVCFLIIGGIIVAIVHLCG